MDGTAVPEGLARGVYVLGVGAAVIAMILTGTRNVGRHVLVGVFSLVVVTAVKVAGSCTSGAYRLLHAFTKSKLTNQKC